MFILNFHGIGTSDRVLSPGEQSVWIQLPFLQDILDLAQKRSDVEVTFDDANESDFKVALPALRARGMKARFFLVAERIDRPGFLSRAQVEGLVKAGMAIGNHGMHHRPWSGLNKHELEEELVAARERLEQVAGREIDQASCPFGSYNRRVIGALQEAGYSSVYTSDGGFAREDVFIRPRNSVYSNWTFETLKSALLPQAGLRRAWRGLKCLLKRWR